MSASVGTRGVVTRFPPEPNGYLHIGHAKSIICLNFGIAAEFGGRCHLRFDDTNPETEDIRYVESIIEDVRWLGFDWGEHLYFASDYFERMYDFAEHLIREGKAYVDSLERGGDPGVPGHGDRAGAPEPYRDRSSRRTWTSSADAGGRVPDGRTSSAPDRPGLAEHAAAGPDPLPDPPRAPLPHRRRWCIYPLYDFAHPIEDAIECVTHSICTLEFENNRPLYDWVVENLPRRRAARDPGDSRPRQYEFARGNLDYTVMSKRKLLELVKAGTSRVGTTRACRRSPGCAGAGSRPSSIRTFWAWRAWAHREPDRHRQAGVRHPRRPEPAGAARALRAPAAAGGLTNYPEGEVEELDAPYFPHDVPEGGSRTLPFSGELYIERDDFMEDPPPGFHRLAPGREVRLRYGYVIRCDEVVRTRRRGRRAALQLRPGHARRQAFRTVARSRAPSTGSPRSTRSPARFASTTGSSACPIPTRARRTSGASEPRLAGRRHRRDDRAERASGPARHPLPVRAARLLLQRPGRLAARSVVVGARSSSTAR
jgi:glutaminyl-tRNA synthetase